MGSGNLSLRIFQNPNSDNIHTKTTYPQLEIRYVEDHDRLDIFQVVKGDQPCALSQFLWISRRVFVRNSWTIARKLSADRCKRALLRDVYYPRVGVILNEAQFRAHVDARKSSNQPTPIKLTQPT